MTNAGSSDQTVQLPRLTLVIGGARSGKSALAERLVAFSRRPRHVIVTAQIWDAEMALRIAAHARARGPDWQLIEAPQNLADAVAQVPRGAALMVDCLTLWLTNRMLAEADLPAETAALTQALSTAAAPVVVVTNEVGLSIVPENALARRFRDEQGRLNQAVAARADLVIGVMAGLPFLLKGQMPEGFTP
jgi:adenosylcobinamide kinase / adenosylcobinamide-phosphate guanylyltransferase